MCVLPGELFGQTTIYLWLAKIGYPRNTMSPEYPNTAFATDSHGFSRIKAVKYFVFKKPEEVVRDLDFIRVHLCSSVANDFWFRNCQYRTELLRSETRTDRLFHAPGSWLGFS